MSAPTVTASATRPGRRSARQAVTADDQLVVGEADSWDVVCRVCGCSDDRPCPGGCVWAQPGDMDGDLCSSCAEGSEP